jgi:HPt (histidine-containing phosphotransfer) domain-containing protein
LRVQPKSVENSETSAYLKAVMTVPPAPQSDDATHPPAADIDAARAMGPAIDLAHLARQTFDDPALQEELLGLFDDQSARLLSRTSAEDAPRLQAVADVHMLRGSALAVGAWRVAAAAQALEVAFERENSEKPEIAAALAALAAAVAEARAAIARRPR